MQPFKFINTIEFSIAVLIRKKNPKQVPLYFLDIVFCILYTFSNRVSEIIQAPKLQN